MTGILDAKETLSAVATIVSSLVHITTRRMIAARNHQDRSLPQQHLHHHHQVKDVLGVTTLAKGVVLLKTHAEKVRETVTVL